MEKLFSGKVYEVLPLSNGIIFSYCKSELDIGDYVEYKMISFDNRRITSVAKNIYLLSKFGNNSKEIKKYCNNFIETKAILLPSGKVFLLGIDGTAQLIDNDGTPVWQGSLSYRAYSPSDIVLHNNALWASYSECNALLRYNLNTMREELRIGGNKSPFDKPVSLFVAGDCVTVCNLGSQKLVQVNLNTYSVLEYQTFEEPVYQYVQSGDYRFAVLQSGLYLI